MLCAFRLSGAVDPLLFKLKTAQKGLEQDFADSNDRFIKEIEVKATQKVGPQTMAAWRDRWCEQVTTCVCANVLLLTQLVAIFIFEHFMMPRCVC